MALKKVALRRLEDGIPNQALREIKALQEIEDHQHVSGAGLPGPLSGASLCSSRTPPLLPVLSASAPLTSFRTHSLLFTHVFLPVLLIRLLIHWFLFIKHLTICNDNGICLY